MDAAYLPLANPPLETSQRFLNSAIEVKALGALPGDVNTKGPTGPQLTIGTFWAYDSATNLGTPPRLYTQIVSTILEETGAFEDPGELARALALINVAMANASIVAWRGKYQHAIQRPVRWIREADSSIKDANWQPLGSPRSKRQTKYCNPSEAALSAQSLIAGREDKQKFTPNFPAYPSGHATFGGACFKLLELLLGTDELGAKGSSVEVGSEELDPQTVDPFTGQGRPDPSVSFATTDDLMEANAYSRILLGVHWDFDGTDGVAAGKIIGEKTASAIYVVS